jgi:N-acetylglucosaminyldiphosphoundecaprenol N-acetyl-beta-D-mannosaminyltransferase
VATISQFTETVDADAATTPRYVRLAGARFAAVTETDAVRRIVAAAAARSGHWTITANLDHLRRYRHEEIVKQLIDNADLVVADGMPLVWASRLSGASLPERVSGSKMIWSISEAACRSRQSIFLLGGDPGIAEHAAQVLLDRYEGLEIAGTLCPPLGFEKNARELERIERRVTEASPHIVFVALGFPKQDLLIQHLRRALPRASFIGVGISLSFVAGKVSRAPGWVQGLGLEWLYRLLHEPGRLARRYLMYGVPFALRFLTGAARHRGGPGIYWGWDYDS